MIKLERRNFNSELRAVEDEMVIEGYAAMFNAESQPLGLMGVREKINPGAFTRTLSEDAQFAHWNHDTNIVLGNTRNGSLQLSEDEVGLKIRAKLPDTQWGRDTYELTKNGYVNQMSFGFETRKQEWDRSNPEAIKRTLVDVRLFEVSIVPYPAYPQTSVQSRSIDEEFEEYRATTQPVPEDKPKFNTDKENEYWRLKLKITGGK